MQQRSWVSLELWRAVKLTGQPAYRLAHEVEVSPSRLSQWLCRIDDVRTGDERLIRVGQLVGVPAKRCFSSTRGK